MKTTDAKLAELEALLNAATPGPWGTWAVHDDDAEQHDNGVQGPFVKRLDGSCFNINVAQMKSGGCEEDDAKLIAALRNALPDLIADLREANAAIELSHGVNQTYAEGELAARVRAEKAEAERDELERECPHRPRADAEVIRRIEIEAERDRLREALREVEKHVQIASCECLDLPKFSCCTCGAYEHAEALALVDRVLGIGVEP